MPDASSGTAAFLGGGEIVNDARTLAYLAAGYGPPNLNVSGGCSCPRIRELIECDSDPYVSPIADPAPWYDSSVPESADFAGFLTAEFQGLGSTYTRAAIDKITGGAVLGRLQPKARVLHWRGFLFGRSETAVQFGLSWMAANLVGQNCSCTGEDLDLLISCPELTETTPEPGCLDLPPVAKPDLCPPFSQPEAFRTLKKVGLVAGPTIISQRRSGCSSSCGSTTCPGVETIIMEIEFSLVAGNPYLYGCPVCLCSEKSFPNNDDEDCSLNPHWIKYTDAEVALILAARALVGDTNTIICPPEECVLQEDCTVDPGCPPSVLPFIPPYEDKCFCTPLDPVQFCCSVPADSFGQFFEGAPVIEIYSGSKSMRSTTIRFFNNPQGLDCCNASSNICLECDSVQIKYIPKDSTMVIDGTTRQVTVQCPGMGAPILADHLTVTPFAWPILSCVDYCICIETEGAQVATDAWVTVSVVPREN